MIKKFNNFLDESVRDKMTPISKEDILRKFSNNFLKSVMDINEFDTEEDAHNWIVEHINEITKLTNTHSSDRIVDIVFSMTDLLRRKLNLKSGGIVDNGYNKSESVIVDKSNIKEVFDFIKSRSEWGIGGYFQDIVKTWDIMDKLYGIIRVKLSIPRFSKSKTDDGRFKAYISFVFDVGATNNPVLVFDAVNTKSPYIWIRLSNASWSITSLEESDLIDKIKRYVK